MFLIFFLLFEFYVTLVDGRFPVKMLIFTIGVIIKTFPQRNHCTLALECQEFKSRLMHMPVATSAHRVRESKDISRISAH